MAQIASDPSMVPDAVAVAHGISIDDAVSSYQRHLRAENRSPNTIKTYLAALYLQHARAERSALGT
ncbi:MAG: hypothetical protein M3406_11405 [Chloroflexota bacterium]|nr:hypothetical protein [Chloroflexota bacterium]